MEQKSGFICEFYKNEAAFLLGANINVSRAFGSRYLLIYLGPWTFCIGWDRCV